MDWSSITSGIVSWAILVIVIIFLVVISTILMMFTKIIPSPI
jgi:hypothetical protein